MTQNISIDPKFLFEHIY